MSILEMTHVSYFFAAMAALSGAAALAMFFAYDIRQCWRIIRRSRADAPPKKGIMQNINVSASVIASGMEKTRELSHDNGTEQLFGGVIEKTDNS